MSSYKYHSVPVTPAVFADMLRELHPNGATLSRQQMISEVTTEHEKRGGLPARGNIASVAKKALATLSSDGGAENTAQGFWRLLPVTDASGVTEPIELGEGPESVYVYYFPAYRDQAAYLGRNEWPMKIGMTVGQPDFRIKEQTGTSMPEVPIVGMIYRTAKASNSEKMLHATLQERGRRISGAPGKEWFMTSLTEVRQILDFVTGDYS